MMGLDLGQQLLQPQQQILEVTKLLFACSGTYHDQVHRPYIPSVNGFNINLYNEITQGQKNVSAQQLAGIAGNIIQPQAIHASVANIPNAWGTQRLRFLMEVKTKTSFGGDVIEVLTGFTNHYGINPNSKAVDDAMQMHFNNVIQIRRTIVNGPTGQYVNSTVIDTSHVLTSPMTMGMQIPSAGMTGLGGFMPPHPNVYTMTPMDVVGELSKSYLGAETIDLRNQFVGNDIRKSQRGNNIPSNYLARTINSISHAIDLTNVTAGSDPIDVYSEARNSVKENYISSDPFLYFLNTHTTFQYARFITFGELAKHFPSIKHPSITKFNIATGEKLAQLPTATGNWEYMTSATMETVIASSLANSVPALMMDLMLTKLTLNATNMVMGAAGAVDVICTNFLGFTEVDLSPYVERFRMLFLNNVWPTISSNNTIDLAIQVNCDVLGDTFVSVSMMGKPAVPYAIPSFGDALFSTIVTPDNSHVVGMAQVINAMTSASAMLGMQNLTQRFNPAGEY